MTSPRQEDRRVIEVSGLTRVFGDFRAVDDIAFHVERGEVFGFLGANGAGKSTTIRILCGLLRPSAGQGHVLGFDILREFERIKPHVGYMSQKFSLYPDLTVTENLEFFGGIYGVPSRRLKDRMAWALQMAELEDKRDTITAELAGGWKQRLALGAALLHEPILLFLDEPTAGVSPDARRTFWNMIRLLAAQGVTVFVTTHYMDEVEHCDRIALMSRGRIVALDTPANLKRTALGGRLVRVEGAPQGTRLQEHLAGAAGILDVQVFGLAHHVVVDAEQNAAHHVARLLSEKGVSFSDIRPVEASLEDVFIAVIGKADR